MKKSFLALALVAGLGAVWTGGAWYTGKQIEEQYPQFIDMLNQEVAKQSAKKGLVVEVQNVQFKSGLFSSEVDYSLSISANNEYSSSLGKLGDKPMVFPFHSTIYHGPLPLNLVQKFNLQPMLASAHSQLVQNEDNKRWFEFAKGSLPFEVETSFAFDDKIYVKGKFADLDGELEGNIVKLKGAKFNIEGSQDAVQRMEFSLDSLSGKNDRLDEKSKMKSVQFNIDQLSFNANLKAGNLPEVYFGSRNMKVANLMLAGEPKSAEDKAFSMQLQNIVGESKQQPQGTKVEMQELVTVEGIQINQVAFGKLEQDMHALIDEKALSDISLATEKGDKELVDAVFSALKQGNKLKYPLQLTNSAGKLNLNLDVESADFDMQKVQENIYSLFKIFSIKAKLEKPALQQFLQDLLVAAGEDKTMAQQKVQELLNMDNPEGVRTAIENNFLVNQEDSFSLNFEVKDNQASLNGTDVPEQKLKQSLFMLMFMALSN